MARREVEANFYFFPSPHSWIFTLSSLFSSSSSPSSSPLEKGGKGREREAQRREICFSSISSLLLFYPFRKSWEEKKRKRTLSNCVCGYKNGGRKERKKRKQVRFGTQEKRVEEPFLIALSLVLWRGAQLLYCHHHFVLSSLHFLQS